MIKSLPTIRNRSATGVFLGTVDSLSFMVHTQDTIFVLPEVFPGEEKSQLVNTHVYVSHVIYKVKKRDRN